MDKAVAVFKSAQEKGRAIVMIADKVREGLEEGNRYLMDLLVREFLIQRPPYVIMHYVRWIGVCDMMILQETASIISEKISRNKPIIMTDIEPMAKGL